MVNITITTANKFNETNKCNGITLIFILFQLKNFKGLIVGATIRYSGSSTPLRHLEVEPLGNATFNHTLPPDTLWLKVGDHTFDLPFNL